MTRPLGRRSHCLPGPGHPGTRREPVVVRIPGLPFKRHIRRADDLLERLGRQACTWPPARLDSPATSRVDPARSGRALPSASTTSRTWHGRPQRNAKGRRDYSAAARSPHRANLPRTMSATISKKVGAGDWRRRRRPENAEGRETQRRPSPLAAEVVPRDAVRCVGRKNSSRVRRSPRRIQLHGCPFGLSRGDSAA